MIVTKVAHYEIMWANTPAGLTKIVQQKINEGWQPYGQMTAIQDIRPGYEGCQCQFLQPIVTQTRKSYQ